MSDVASSALARLQIVVRELSSTVVAFSGGVDSALVLKVAHDELGDRAFGLTALGPAVPAREREDAARIARAIGVRHRVVDSHEIDDPDYRRNSPRRCFHCKSELYRIAEQIRNELGFAWVANGTNRDDLGDYRPGLEAAANASVRSPLVEAGLDKNGVREAARACGLDVWDKPEAACLSSRIPYGTEVTPERLHLVERLEDALLALGLRQVRVRFHGSVARIEVAESEIEAAFAVRKSIVSLSREIGFEFATLDLAGYRRGSLNVLR